MKIPFLAPNSRNNMLWQPKSNPSKTDYLKLYMAIHDNKDLMEEQILELQGLLSQKLKAHRDLRNV